MGRHSKDDEDEHDTQQIPLDVEEVDTAGDGQLWSAHETAEIPKIDTADLPDIHILSVDPYVSGPFSLKSGRDDYTPLYKGGGYAEPLVASREPEGPLETEEHPKRVAGSKLLLLASGAFLMLGVAMMAFSIFSRPPQPACPPSVVLPPATITVPAPTTTETG